MPSRSTEQQESESPQQPEEQQEPEQLHRPRVPQPGQLSSRSGPTTPPAGDVPGIWVRSPRSGLLSFVPLKMDDTIKRCLSEGFTMEGPPWETGRPVNGQPTRPKDELGVGGSAGVTHIYHG